MEYPKYYQQIPLYRKLYGDNLKKIDFEKSKSKLPVLTKKEIAISFPTEWMTPLLEDALKQDLIEFVSTSGTTTDRMQILRKKNWWASEFKTAAKYNHLLKRLHLENNRRVVLTTPMCSNTHCFKTLPSYEDRILDNTLYLNSTVDPFDWKKSDIERIIQEIERFQPINVDADPIYLVIFLNFLKEYGLDFNFSSIEFITLCYEFCPRNCLDYIKDFFQCQVLDIYGATETGHLYSRIDNGLYTLFPYDLAISFKCINSKNNLYEIFITSFKNEYMPLINYQIGDVVKIYHHDVDKIDGKESEVRLSRMCGRTSAITYDSLSQVITLDDLDKIVAFFDKNIFLYQILFDENRVVFKYVTLNGQALSEKLKLSFENALNDLYKKKLSLIFEHLPALSPSGSGKFQLVQSGRLYEI